MTFTEPTTAITDYILAVSGFIYGILLLRQGRRGTGLFWPIGFFTAAAAAWIGGVYHGFSYYLTGDLPNQLRSVTMALIGASAAFMVCGAIAGPLKHGAENTQFIRAGFVLSAAGIAIQKTGISLHANFNHNDLYHCLQIVAFYLLFKGARLS